MFKKLRKKIDKWLFGNMDVIPEDDYLYRYPSTEKEEVCVPKRSGIFGDKKLFEPFTVYVIFKHNVGKIAEYQCVLTPTLLFDFPFFYRGYNIKLFCGCGDYCFELHNAPLSSNAWLNYDWIPIKGDGSDAMYSHGSEKYVYLNVEKAIEEAKTVNNHFVWWSEQVKRDIECFEKKHVNNL